jgi:hypothetical protein
LLVVVFGHFFLVGSIQWGGLVGTWWVVWLLVDKHKGGLQA